MAFTTAATKVFPAVATLVLLLTGVGARAQQPSPDQIAAVRASCRSDFMANCSGVQPGGKDALDCLKRNLGKLSGSCRMAVGALTPPSPAASTAPAAAAPTAPALAAPPPPQPATATSSPTLAAPTVAAKPPAPPVAKHTPPAAPAASATATATATPPPPVAMPEAPNVMVLPPREALRIVRICAADQQALCAGVPPGGGRIIACLMRNQAALSPLCKNALAMAQSR